MVIKRDGAAAAIIPAAGVGKRMGSGKPKQYLELNGRPIFVMALQSFEQCELIEETILVVPGDEISICADLVKKWQLHKVKHIVAGGNERQNSVANGLAEVSSHIDIVAVHDGVRPLVTPGLISRVVEAAILHGAAIPSLPVIDTVKKREGDWVQGTVDRRQLWRIQTPQCFRKPLLERAYKLEALGSMKVTDSASLVELLGHKVFMVQGEETNIKITTPADLLIAEHFLKSN